MHCIRTFSLYSLAILIDVAVSIPGCDSNLSPGMQQQVHQLDDTSRPQKQTTYSLANERVYFENIPDIDNNTSSSINSLLCSGPFLDPSSYKATYKGMKTEFFKFPYDHADPVAFTFIYEIEVAANLVPNFSLGTVQISKTTWPMLPSVIQTSIPAWELLATKYDAALETDVNVYKVTFQTYLNYLSFCGYYEFRTKLRLNSDCADIDIFTTAYSSFHTFTPTNYQPYDARVSPGIAGSIQVIAEPSVCLCLPRPCHESIMPFSPNVIFEYRNASKGEPWQAKTYNFLTTNYITGLNSGDTYEYHSKGLLSLPDDYDYFGPVLTIVVP